MTETRRALATDFGIWLAFKDLHNLSDAMLRSQDQWAALANYVLLYDQVVIPTGNIQILPVLRLMLGESVFDELVRSKVIVLARYDQWFGFSGGGGGLGYFKIHAGPNRADGGRNLGLSHFLPLDEAIDVAIGSTNPTVDDRRRRDLSRLLLENIVEVPISNDAVRLTQETYKDVRESPYLREMLSLKERDLNNIGDLPGNKLSIFNPHLPREGGESKEIRSLLRVAFENFILHLGTSTKADDITGDNGTLTLLRAKGQRFGSPVEGQHAFAQIQRISGVPNLGAAFAAKIISPEKLLALRDSKHGKDFRDWFGKGAPSDSAQDTVERFVEELALPSWIDQVPAKLLRFAATTGLGALHPVTGAVASGVDSFLLSRWFPGKSPRLFLKQAKVMLARQPLVTSQPGGRDRNKLCYCGSGKKYKHCHGRL